MSREKKISAGNRRLNQKSLATRAQSLLNKHDAIGENIAFYLPATNFTVRFSESIDATRYITWEGKEPLDDGSYRKIYCGKKVHSSEYFNLQAYGKPSLSREEQDTIAASKLGELERDIDSLDDLITSMVLLGEEDKVSDEILADLEVKQQALKDARAEIHSIIGTGKTVEHAIAEQQHFTSAANVPIDVLHWSQYVPYRDLGVIPTIDNEKNRVDHPFINVDSFSFESRLAQAVKVERDNSLAHPVKFAQADESESVTDELSDKSSSLRDSRPIEQAQDANPILLVNHEKIVEPVKGKTHAKEMAHRIRHQADMVSESMNVIKHQLHEHAITPQSLLAVSSSLELVSHLQGQLSELHSEIDARSHLLPVKHGNIKHSVNDIVGTGELESLVGELTELKTQITNALDAQEKELQEKIAAQEIELQEKIAIDNEMLGQQADTIFNRGMGIAEKYAHINEKRSQYLPQKNLNIAFEEDWLKEKNLIWQAKLPLGDGTTRVVYLGHKVSAQEYYHLKQHGKPLVDTNEISEQALQNRTQLQQDINQINKAIESLKELTHSASSPLTPETHLAISQKVEQLTGQKESLELARDRINAIIAEGRQVDIKLEKETGFMSASGVTINTLEEEQFLDAEYSGRLKTIDSDKMRTDYRFFPVDKHKFHAVFDNIEQQQETRDVIEIEQSEGVQLNEIPIKAQPLFTKAQSLLAKHGSIDENIAF